MTHEAHLLTDAGLDQIEQRCRAASKPPWQSFIEVRDHTGGDDFIRVGGMDDSEPDMYVSRSTTEGLVPASDADLDFIAHARQDLPLLLTEVRRLRAAQPATEPDVSAAKVGSVTSGEAHQIAAAANTVVPALLALGSLGYTIVVDGSLVVATASNERFAADDPVTVLGLVKLIETRSWNWKASDEEITATLGRFGWNPKPG